MSTQIEAVATAKDMAVRDKRTMAIVRHCRDRRLYQAAVFSVDIPYQWDIVSLVNSKGEIFTLD